MLIVRYEKQGWKAYSLSQGNWIAFVCISLPSELAQDQQRCKHLVAWGDQVASHRTNRRGVFIHRRWVLSFLPSVDGLLKWRRAGAVRVAKNVACGALRLCFSSHKQGCVFRSLRSTVSALNLHVTPGIGGDLAGRRR